MTSRILFHQLKHHLHYLRAWIEGNSGTLSNENIQAIKTIGSSQLDMYCGGLGVNEILRQVNNHLQLHGVTENGQYRVWVGNGYKLITLSDDSRFTLRCIDNDKPVHIHPARHAPLTVRVKATALKSVVCYLLANAGAANIEIGWVNALRSQYLGLPPVSQTAGIAEMRKVASLLAGGPTVSASPLV